ncbi:MAG: hypothetical protein Q9167_000992 [Letrouitia subvulpina]
MEFYPYGLEVFQNPVTPSLHGFFDQDASTLPLLCNDAPDPGVRQEAPTNQQDPALYTPQDPTTQVSHESREMSTPFGQSALQQMSWFMQPNEADWERYKPQIVQLYRNETLEAVKDIMKKKHRFNASTKMYKNRIGKWGLNKHIKSNEMQAIIRKQAQRSCGDSKKSAFRLRNYPVSGQKILRCRRNFKILSDDQALRLRANTPPDLICYTPLTSPITTPRELETPELIAKLVEEYISGSFDSKVWIIRDDQDFTCTKGSTDSAVDFSQLCDSAIVYFVRGETKRAWQALDMAMALTRQLLSDDDPDFLSLFFISMGKFLDCSSFDFRILNKIAPMLLRHFYEMSSAVMGRQHPFSRIFSRLMGLEKSILEHVFSVALQCQSEWFAKRVGRFSRTMMMTLRYRYLSPWESVDSRVVEQFLADLAEYEHVLGPSDERCLQMRLNLAYIYLDSQQSGQAAEIAHCMINTTLAAQEDLFLADYFYILSMAQYNLSFFELAEQNIRQAINIQADTYGWQDERVLNYMLELASWLKEWNRHDEAAEIDRHVQMTWDSKHERLRREEEEQFQRYLAATGNKSS